MDTRFELSNHARLRGQQRGITNQTICFVYQEHDCQRHIGGGLRAVYLSRRRVAALREQGVRAQDLDRASGVFLVINPKNRNVITVLHDIGRRGRRYRKQHKNGHRRRRAFRN